MGDKIHPESGGKSFGKIPAITLDDKTHADFRHHFSVKTNVYYNQEHIVSKISIQETYD